MRRTWNKLAAAALAALLVSACVAAQNGGTVTEPGSTSGPSNGSAAESGSPPLSNTTPPTLRPPSGPPKSPTDQQPEWIAGRVTRGGSGPCYGLETDDGTQYALYNAEGITLEMGAVVRVRVEPLLVKIDCGSGQHVHMIEAETVG